MIIEQLSLLSAGLPPLRLGQKVRVIAEGWDGVVAQIPTTPDGAYAVFSPTWHGPIDAGLPIYRRDELEMVDE